MWRTTTSTPLVRTQVPGELFSQKDRPVLASGAAERDHQVREAATLISGYAGINERLRVCEVLMNALLLIEIVNHWSHLCR